MSALCGAASCRSASSGRVVAEGGATVCAGCRETTVAHLRGLVALYDDLLRPTRVGAPMRRSEGSERPLALPGGAIEARAAIRHELRRWSAHNTFRIRATPNSHDLAEEARHVRGLLTRYLSTDLGPALVDGIDAVWAQAWRAAFPSRPAGYVIGTCPCAAPDGSDAACGGRVKAMIEAIEADAFAMCQKCDASAHLEWWRENLPAAHDEWMTITDLRWHIVIMVGVRVPTATVHSWVHRGHLETTVDQSGRVTYQVDSALALSRRAAGRLAKAYGHRPELRDELRSAVDPAWDGTTDRQEVSR